MKKIFSLFLIFSLASILPAVEVTLTKSILIKQNKDKLIKCPGSFFVTEDDLMFILDKKDSNIKIFNLEGDMIQIFGRKGMGPGEFITPFCSAYKSPWVVLMDFGRRSCFIFKRSPESILIKYDRFIDLSRIYEYQIINDEEILITGDKRNRKGKVFSLSIYNHKKKNYKYLLPFEKSYGIHSVGGWLAKDKDFYGPIGSILLSAWHEDTIFHAWEANLKILKINQRSGKITSFGKKTTNYIQPSVSAELKKAFNQRKNHELFLLTNNMSYILCLFTTKSGNVGVVYTGFPNKNNRFRIMLQLYKKNGAFIKEVEIHKPDASHYNELYLYFRKDKNFLYILDTETTEDFDQLYHLHEYRIIQ